MKRHHHIALWGALLLAIVGVILATQAGGPASSPSSIASSAAQRQIAQQAAVAPNPLCGVNVPKGHGHMGVCQPRQALTLAQAIAPQGNAVTAVPNVNAELAGKHGGSLIEGVAEAADAQLNRGVDVSSYQGCNIDWSYVRRATGITYAIPKGTESLGYVDQCGPHNVAGIRAAGMYVALYVFDRTYADPRAEADRAVYFARQWGWGGPGSLPIFDDAETNDSGLSGPSWCAHQEAVVRELAAQSPQHRAGIYSAPFMWPAGGCPLMPPGTVLWSATYGPSWSNLSPLVASLWQYSDGQVGPVPRIFGWDSDIWLYSSSELAALAGVQPPIPPATSTQTQECNSLRYWRTHGHGGDDGVLAIRNSLAANYVSCPDSKAIHFKVGPSPPQPAPNEFLACTLLLRWRHGGRPPAERPARAHDVAWLKGLHVSCDGRPPLVAVHH